MNTNYNDLYRTFSWSVPAHFNFGSTIDEYAMDPARVALIYEDQEGNRARLTFADLSRQSNQIANALAGLGLKPGAPILLMLPRITLWQAAYIGALKAGLLVIPCTSMLREKDVVYRATHSGAQAIIASPSASELISDLRNKCPSLQHFLVAGSDRSGWKSLHLLMRDSSPKFSAVNNRAGDAAICYYTSGTTKDPKAALHSHAYTWTHRYTGSLWLNVGDSGVHWTTSDTGWAKAAYGVLFGPWMNGATTFMYNGRFEPRKQLELLRRYAITTFCAPPTEYRMLIKEDLSKYKFPMLQHCTGAGEPLNPEVIEVWKRHFNLTIHDGYGQTESTLLSANLPGMEIKPGSMGRPFPGHDVVVLNSEAAETKAEEIGEIAVRVKPHRPPSLFLEYWKNPEETSATHRGDFYLTGDQAYRDTDGYLWFVGRADDVIISAGYRIGPFEVESALLEHPAVLESAVVASPDPDRGSIVKAFIKLKPGAEAGDQLVAELQDHCKRITAPYKYPREIDFVTDLPKTVSGKIRRVELRKSEEARKGS